MKICLLLCLIVSFVFCQAQKLNKIYYGVSCDSIHSDLLFELKNDSVLEISSLPRHMSKQFVLTIKYRHLNGELEVYSNGISKQDSLALIKYRLQQFLNKVVLTIDGKALKDNSNNIVYVLYNDFKDKYYLTYLIDKRVYKQETGLADAYGIIKNNTKENKELQDKLALVTKESHNYSVKVFKGLEAYNKFGYNSVFGVIEFKRK